MGWVVRLVGKEMLTFDAGPDCEAVGYHFWLLA